MKRVYVSMLILIAGLCAATWTVENKEAVSVTSQPWPKHQTELGRVYKGETGTIVGKHDDWAQVQVIGSNLAGWVWAPVVENELGNALASNVTIGSSAEGKQGCALFANPLNDVSGVHNQEKAIAFLKAGTELKVIGFTRPTWYLVEFNLPMTKLRKETATIRGWCYAPYGSVK